MVGVRKPDKYSRREHGSRPACLFPPPSTLVLEGEGLKLESLKLDGALVIKACEGARVLVRGLEVCNEGWEMVPLPQDGSEVLEEDRWVDFRMSGKCGVRSPAFRALFVHGMLAASVRDVDA